MKILFGLLLAVISLFALIGAEKPAACLEAHSRNGDGLLACDAYFPAWSYNAAEDICVNFIYGGCLGNANRFGTQDECEKTCRQ